MVGVGGLAYQRGLNHSCATAPDFTFGVTGFASVSGPSFPIRG